MYQMDKTIISNFKNTSRRELLWVFVTITTIITLFYSILFVLGVDLKPGKRCECCAAECVQAAPAMNKLENNSQ